MYLTIFLCFILPEFVSHLDKDRLYISNLPSLAEFERFYYAVNVRHWVNVSGIDLYQIYPELASSGYSISQFEFADIFTDGEKLTDFSEIEKITTELYENVSVEQHRHALLEAVNAIVVQLENQVSTCVFCHRGLARSPLVTAAALNHFHNESLLQSIARVQALHPRAYFTDISVSALIWCKEQLRNPVIA
jgi:hypothetical protein